ncbi:MAG TPA: hypothetical protein VFH58_05595 [Acidimicrobiales bacterium]|nr:hypothetical protein [Acidimicrobiales bacterium]
MADVTDVADVSGVAVERVVEAPATEQPEPTAPVGEPVRSSAWARARAYPGIRLRSASAGGRLVWWMTGLVLAVALCAVGVGAGSPVRHKASFNPIDELAHYDYVVRVAHGSVPRWGDLYSSQSVHMVNCQGDNGPLPQHCANQPDPRRLAPQGFSYEAQQPPLAYLAYVPFYSTSGSAASDLTRVRLGGTLLRASGALLLLVVAWLADMSVLETAVLLALCLLNAAVIQVSNLVDNDSSCLVAGALALVMVQVARRRQKPMIMASFAVGLVIGLFKGIYFVAPLALVIAGLSMEERPPRMSELRGFWRRRGSELSLLAGALVSYAGFLAVQNARALVPAHQVLRALLGFLTSPRPTWKSIEMSAQAAYNAFAYGSRPLYWLLNLLVFGVALGAVLVSRDRRAVPVRALALGALVALPLVTEAFSLLNYVEIHVDIAASARYDLPVVPILAFVAARALRPRAQVLVGLVLPALAVYSLTHGHPF